MSTLRYLRDFLVFAPCYIALDWASYIDPVGPFNITPWNPQHGLAIVWLLLGGPKYAPAVLVTVAAAEALLRDLPGGLFIAAFTTLMLTGGFVVIAWLLRALISDLGLRSTRDLTTFVTVVTAGTAVTGAAFVGLLRGADLLGPTSVTEALLRFWVGDAVGVLITAPLLLAVADAGRRADLLALVRRRETLLQAAALVVTIWLTFYGLGGDPATHFYLLFVPLIWIAARGGMNGAVAATAVVQIGLVIGIHGKETGSDLPILELHALVAALTLTGLYLGMMVDERQRATEMLKQSLRLAAAGEMAGAIAHEVNQPLTALTNYGKSAEMLLAAGHGPPELREIVGKIMSEAQRAADVVRRLRDFFRTGSTRLEPVGVDELLITARRIADQLAREQSITIEVLKEEELPPLLVDRLQVELVLRNLLSNAVESIGSAAIGQGRIQIIAKRDAAQARFIVTDNGPGIAPAARDGVFEPFVSGKPTGMGLGLAVSRAIAEAHGGSLDVKIADHGEFHLVLPCQRT
jgi:two-component system, LuxR family, sensor kinase FixL